MKTFNSTRSSHGKVDQPWFDDECAELKINLNRQLRICRKNNFSSDLLNCYKNLKSRYKTTSKSKRKKFDDDLIYTLQTTKDCAARWKIVNLFRRCWKNLNLLFLKKLLSVPLNTPETAIKIETGRYHISLFIFNSVISWVTKLLKMSDNRLPDSAFLAY